MEFAREISIPQKLWFISIPKKLLKLMIKFLQILKNTTLQQLRSKLDAKNLKKVNDAFFKKLIKDKTDRQTSSKTGGWNHITSPWAGLQKKLWNE